MNEGLRDHPNVIMFPPLILLLAFIAAVLLEWLVPVVFLAPIYHSKFQTGFSAILALSGISIALLAMFELRRAGTHVEPHKPTSAIVNRGLYRLTRNPIYLGMVLFYFGVCVFWNLEWGVILTPIYAAIMHHGVIKREEAYLTDKFGDEYRAYRKDVRRWF